MLVLTRKIRESIVIGDNIVIEILDAAPGKIRIGIAAPTSVRVVRGELIPLKLDEPKPDSSKLDSSKLDSSKLDRDKTESSGRSSDAGVAPERPFPQFKRPLRGRRGKQNTSGANPSKAGKQWDSGRNAKTAQVPSGQAGQTVPASPVTTEEAEVPRLTAVRTVADIARCRLRQLREQIAARKNAGEVAETKAEYLIDGDLVDGDLVDGALVEIGLPRRRYWDGELSDINDTVLDDTEFFDDDALLGTQSFREPLSFRESLSFADEMLIQDKMSFEMYWRAEGLVQDPKQSPVDIRPTQASSRGASSRGASSHVASSHVASSHGAASHGAASHGATNGPTDGAFLDQADLPYQVIGPVRTLESCEFDRDAC